MGGRSLILALAALIAVGSTMFIVLLRSSDGMATNYTKYYTRQSAQNIAQTGANMALEHLAQDPYWRSGFTLNDIMGGRVKVRLSNVTFDGIPAVEITSVGYMNFGSSIRDYDSPTGTLARAETSIVYTPQWYIPGTTKAAVTTNNQVQTIGTIAIDGRNHSKTGALIASTGTYGIWTTQTYSQAGNSTIGGTYNGIDYPPANPGDPNSYAQNQTWPGGYPGSPDSILGGPEMGFPEGFLKAVAQSGYNGSQYVTNPATLTYPLQGITYVELPSAATWQSMDITGSGILIVHNTDKNAIMKNLNSGTFVGLMVVDDLVHFHGATLIGAAVCLSPNPSEGNCIGNSQGNILYSNEAIGLATVQPPRASDANVLAWWE
jgi:hypothetical protein